MKIVLKKNGEDKSFSQFFVSAKFMRKALELRNEMNLNNLSNDDLDTVVDFVVEVFDKQFTADEVYEGIAYDKLLDTVFENVFMVILQGRKQEDVEEPGNGKK